MYKTNHCLWEQTTIISCIYIDDVAFIFCGWTLAINWADKFLSPLQQPFLQSICLRIMAMVHTQPSQCRQYSFTPVSTHALDLEMSEHFKSNLPAFSWNNFDIYFALFLPESKAEWEQWGQWDLFQISLVLKSLGLLPWAQKEYATEAEGRSPSAGPKWACVLFFWQQRTFIFV